MKKLLLIILIAVTGFSSCTYYTSEGLDGESFLKINWVTTSPTYIATDGALPDNFYWDTYYRTSPGFYNISFEYEEYSSFQHAYVVYPYDVEIEVYYYEGDYGRDGDDVYFELVLYPDGYVDYYHEVDYKAETVDGSSRKDVAERTLLGQREEVKGNKKMVFKYYQSPAYTKQ